MRAELWALASGNICNPDRELTACREEFGDNVEWACENCPKARLDRLSGRTMKVVFLRTLQAGGYPYEAEELSLEDWLALGLAAEIEDQARLYHELSPWMGS